MDGLVGSRRFGDAPRLIAEVVGEATIGDPLPSARRPTVSACINEERAVPHRQTVPSRAVRRGICAMARSVNCTDA